MSTTKDHSNGYEACATDFIKHRSTTSIGVSTVRIWANTSPHGSAILDMGCGNGLPITKCLTDAGHHLYGVDASPSMVTSFRKNLPEVPVQCESVETSSFFNQTFDGVVAWGLLFLLTEQAQQDLIMRVGQIIHPGGQFLFTAPRHKCTWTDVLTGKESRSLGQYDYTKLLTHAGFKHISTMTDEGQNNYFLASK